ncbi:MAG: DUF6798 domain-containing protein [Thermoguttaceae bacterium]
MGQKPYNWKILFLYLLEIAGIFSVLYAHGAWPVPDVNEANYLGKAIHFWNPDWVKGDVFLDSQDTHKFFYVTVGALSLVFSPFYFAWISRILAWVFFAWAWRRLSFTFIPVRFFSILTAACFVYYLDAFQMSGEWVIGGVEGKSFAFPFVLLGIEAISKGHWNRVWIYFGIASAFHVLVGGWSVIIALGVWLVDFVCEILKSKKSSNLTKTLKRALIMVPFLVLGGVLSLPGLKPALQVDAGCSLEMANRAHWITVFDRLPHHLVPYPFNLDPPGFPWTYQLRFAALSILWFVLSFVVLRTVFRVKTECSTEVNNEVKTEINTQVSTQAKPENAMFLRMSGYVAGSLVLSVIGYAIAIIFRNDQQAAANLLRFYWFRMSDFAVPLGFAIVSGILFNWAAAKWLEVKHRREEIQAVLITFIGGVAAFLLYEFLIFGLLFFTFWPPADPGVAWALTLTTAVLLLFVCEVYFRRRNMLGVASSYFANIWLLILFCVVIWGPSRYILECAEQRTRFSYSRSDSLNYRIARGWDNMCKWINDPKNGIPHDAKFLTPKESITFKWNTQRPEVAIRKEMPQDSASIIKWFEAIEELFYYTPKNGPVIRDASLQQLMKRFPIKQLKKIRDKYGFEFIVCGKYPALELPVIYDNNVFVIYDVRDEALDVYQNANK